MPSRTGSPNGLYREMQRRQLVTTCDSPVCYPSESDISGVFFDRTVLFGEYSCKGPGASTRNRVPWSRSLTYDEARPFLGPSFINGEQWLRL